MIKYFLTVLLIIMLVSAAEAEVQNVKVSGDVQSAGGDGLS